MLTLFFGEGLSIQAATFQVPQDFKKIGDALAVAHDGDEVVVSPGTYQEYLAITGKVTLRSTFDGKDWSIIENTRIQGQISINTSISGPAHVKGFRIGFDPISLPPEFYVQMGGIVCNNTAEIEYCIIENCQHQGGTAGGAQPGYALFGVKGLIQNNIIRNNRADFGGSMCYCEGTIRNNLIYNDNGYEVGIRVFGYNTQFVNNTVYSLNGISFSSDAPVIDNDIFWVYSTSSLYFGIDPRCFPRNCLIKNYTGPGRNIITTNPRFADQGHGDFRLTFYSPCINAGLTTTATPTTDILGFARGTECDIGAYEYTSVPVLVWLPNNDTKVYTGEGVSIAWKLEVRSAGTVIDLQLYSGTTKIVDLGNFSNATGTGIVTLNLPKTLAAGTYRIKGVGVQDNMLMAQSASFSIDARNAAGHWAIYR